MTPRPNTPRPPARQPDPIARAAGRFFAFTLLAVPTVAAWVWLIRYVILPAFGSCQ